MSTVIRGLSRGQLTRGLVQVSLDLTSIEEALRMARIAVDAGADWLEVGTPLIMSGGVAAVQAVRREFPDHPLIADLKIMDGGYGEVRMYGDAGADAVVVMGRSHDATVQRVCDAAADCGLLVMGDDMAAENYAAEARRLEALGVGMVLHHLGHDHRSAHREQGLSPLTALPEVVQATALPVQAVGGLSIDQAIDCPGLGAGVVVFGAPLVIDEEKAFTISTSDLPAILGDAIDRVHSTDVVYP